MTVVEWLRAFRTLHERAKKGDLAGEEAQDYAAGCDELARALLAAQRQAARPGEAPRHALRVARAMQVDLESPVTKQRAMTVDVAVTGFSVLLARPPGRDELKATLRVPGGDPIVVDVIPAEVKQQPGTSRVGFIFARLAEKERQRLELLVIDTALSQLAG